MGGKTCLKYKVKIMSSLILCILCLKLDTDLQENLLNHVHRRDLIVYINIFHNGIVHIFVHIPSKSHFCFFLKPFFMTSLLVVEQVKNDACLLTP